MDNISVSPTARLYQNKYKITATTRILSAKYCKYLPQRMPREIEGKQRLRENWRTWSVRGWPGCNSCYINSRSFHTNSRKVRRRAQTPPRPRTTKAQHHNRDGEKKSDTVASPPPCPRHNHQPPPLRLKWTASRRAHIRTSRGRYENKEKNKNPTVCKYCTKYGGNGLAHGSPNNILHYKCNYNNKWKGWRPKWVRKKIGVDFKEYDNCS